MNNSGVADALESSITQNRPLLNRFTVGSVQISSWGQSCLWEAVGTALFTIGVLTNTNPFGIAIAQALAFILIHQMTGAQMNPIVTLNLTLRNKVQPLYCIVNILGQQLGSILGGLLVYMTNDGGVYSPQAISGNINEFQAFCQITVGSFFLLMMLSIQLDSRSRMTTDTFIFGVYFAIIIFTAQQCAVGASGSLNPAIVTGLSIANSIVTGTYVQIQALWVLLVAPFVGSLLAALFFTMVFIPTLNITQNYYKNHAYVVLT